MTKAKGDGDAFLDFLDAHEVSQIRLAREMGRSPTSMGRYVEALNAGHLSDEKWTEILEALRRLKVNDVPTGVRSAAHRDPAADRAHLQARAALFTTRQQLEALIEICDASRDVQAFFRAIIVGRLIGPAT